MSKPRAYTAEELREIFLGHVRVMVDYWDGQHSQTTRQKLEGLAFSILVAIDGGSGGVPFATQMIATAHPDDKAHCIKEGENWVEPGTDYTEGVNIHDHFFRKDK